MSTWFIVLCIGVGAAWAREGSTAEDARKGHDLAVVFCATCHMTAPDQPIHPILQPPGPSFASIAQRKDFSADWLQHFINTTHRGLDNPQGMPRPNLPIIR